MNIQHQISQLIKKYKEVVAENNELKKQLLDKKTIDEISKILNDEENMNSLSEWENFVKNVPKYDEAFGKPCHTDDYINKTKQPKCDVFPYSSTNEEIEEYNNLVQEFLHGTVLDKKHLEDSNKNYKMHDDFENINMDEYIGQNHEQFANGDIPKPTLPAHETKISSNAYKVNGGKAVQDIFGNCDDEQKFYGFRRPVKVPKCDEEPLTKNSFVHGKNNTSDTGLRRPPTSDQQILNAFANGAPLSDNGFSKPSKSEYRKLTATDNINCDFPLGLEVEGINDAFFENHRKFVESQMNKGKEAKPANRFPIIKDQKDFMKLENYEYLKIVGNIRVNPANDRAVSLAWTWDLSECTDTSYMFEGCNLKSASHKWKLPKVRNAEGMFKNCKLFNGNVSAFGMEQCENFNSMFEGCENFDGIGLNDWRMKNAHSMRRMFAGCSLMCKPEIENWHHGIKTCKDFTEMFYECPRLQVDLSRWIIAHDAKVDKMLTGIRHYIPLYGGNTRYLPNKIKYEQVKEKIEYINSKNKK